MMNIIVRNKRKLMATAVVAGMAGALLLAITLFLAVWWGTSLAANLASGVRMLMKIAGVVLIPSSLYFLMKQNNKFLVFCDVYDEALRHSPRVMFHSLVKYLSIIFIFAAVVSASYGVALILAPLSPAACILIMRIAKYIKLWKYHGYSVPMLMFLTAGVIAVSVALSPVVRPGIWAVAEAFIRFFNI